MGVSNRKVTGKSNRKNKFVEFYAKNASNMQVTFWFFREFLRELFYFVEVCGMM